jgi:hypothetical protein
MKIQNILRTQAIVIGVGAAFLLLATPAKSQEIVNSEFSDGPYVTSFAQPTANTAAASATPAPVTSGTVNSNAQVATVAIATPVVTEEMAVSFSNTVARWLTACTVLGIAMLVIYAWGEIRRANRKGNGSRPQVTQGPALS